MLSVLRHHLEEAYYFPGGKYPGADVLWGRCPGVGQMSQWGRCPRTALDVLSLQN